MSATIELHNIDCMEYLATLEDNAFELAIIDPPYGINVAQNGVYFNSPGKSATKGIRNKKKEWDKNRPSKEFWPELFRVSKNQIIWGANYFIDALYVSRGWVCWDKKQPLNNSFSDFELAWTSFDCICKTFRLYPTHTVQGKRIHPTQKPVKLYEWLLMNYAKEGDRILDTHLGSGSIAIACDNLGFNLVGCELDTDYFNAAKKRLHQHQSQLRIPMT